LLLGAGICIVALHPPLAVKSIQRDRISTIVVVGHGSSGRRQLLRSVFQQSAWLPSREDRSLTTVLELRPSSHPQPPQLRFSAGDWNGSGDSAAALWVEAWGAQWRDAPPGSALERWVEACVAAFQDFSTLSTPSSYVPRHASLRVHVRVYNPALPVVRLVLPPAYFATGTLAGQRTLQEIKAVVAAEAAADATAHFLWAFPAPTDPANSSVRQDIIAACGVAERTTGVMTKCDLVRSEFDTPPGAFIAKKLDVLRKDEPPLGGGWIAMANACSVKEAMVAWKAAGSPEGQRERFERENMRARERATFERILHHPHVSDDQRAVIAPAGVFGERALRVHLQHMVFDRHAEAAGNPPEVSGSSASADPEVQSWAA